MKLLLILVGAVVFTPVVGLLLRAWWRRFKLRRISEWIASALLSIAGAPSALLERRLRENVARVLGIPVRLIRLRRERGGARLRVILCGPAVEEAGRFHAAAVDLTMAIRLHLPPWTEFSIEGDSTDAGEPEKIS